MVQILENAARGRSYKQTAFFIGITHNTVRVYAEHMLKQMQCDTIAHAVAVALRSGWIK